MIALACVAVAALIAFVPAAAAREQCSEAGGECPAECGIAGVSCSEQDAGTVTVEATRYVCRKTQAVGCDWLASPNNCTIGAHDDGIDGLPDCGIPVLNIIIEPLGIIKTKYDCHADITTNYSETEPTCRTGYKRVRKETGSLQKPATKQCCDTVRTATPTPAPCEGVSCDDKCEGATRKEDGQCNLQTGSCVYQSVQANSSNCGYVPPLRLFSIDISPPFYAASIGEQIQFNATAYNIEFEPIADVPVVWNVTNTSQGTVSSTGLFTAVATGKTSVFAIHQLSNTAGYAEITVISLTNFVLYPASPLTVLVGTRVPFMAKGTDAVTGRQYSLNPSWNWNGTATARVEPTGTNSTVAVFTPSTTGSGTLAATQRVGTGSTATDKKATASVTVVGSAGEAASIEIIPGEADLPPITAGPNTLKFYALVRDDSGVIIGGGTPAWRSSVPAVGNITADGVFTPYAAGSTVVSVTLGSLSDEIAITVGACIDGSTRQCAVGLPGLFGGGTFPASQTCNSSRVFGACYLTDPCSGQTACAVDPVCTDAKCGPRTGQQLHCRPCGEGLCNQFTDPDCSCDPAVGATVSCAESLSGCWGTQTCGSDGALSTCVGDPLCLGGDTGLFNVVFCAKPFSQTEWDAAQAMSASSFESFVGTCGTREGPWTSVPAGVTPTCFGTTTFLLKLYNASDSNFPNFTDGSANARYAWNATPEPPEGYAYYFDSPHYRFVLDSIPRGASPSNVFLRGLNLTDVVPRPAVFVANSSFAVMEPNYEVKLINASSAENWANLTYRYYNCST